MSDCCSKVNVISGWHISEMDLVKGSSKLYAEIIF